MNHDFSTANIPLWRGEYKNKVYHPKEGCKHFETGLKIWEPYCFGS